MLIPQKDLMKKLKEESTSMNSVLEQVKYRAEWIKHQEAQRRREEEEAEKERGINNVLNMYLSLLFVNSKHKSEKM